MRIIQFTTENPVVVQKLIGFCLEQVNTWSLLQDRSANDPGYVTQPWGPETWQTKVDDPNIYWVNFDGVYDHLGDNGRIIANRLLIPGPDSGILLNLPFFKDLDPAAVLSLIEVEDLVAAGYVTLPPEGQ